MANIRLTVVVRKDLKMVEGLLASQVAHIASIYTHNALLKCLHKKDDIGVPDLNPDQWDWLENPYLSVLAVHCKEDLEEIYTHAEREDLPFNTWTDVVPSPTFADKSITAMVGVAIGPADFDKIKIVTGALEPY